MLWKYFQNCMYSFRENWKINLTICYTTPRFNPSFVYHFTEIETTFPVPSWDYVADCLWLRGMVSICLIWKGKYEWFLHEGLLLDWLIFLLYLLQSVCCSKYSAKITNFSFLNLFLHLLHSFVLKYLRIFVTVMLRFSFTAFKKFSTRGTWKRILLILSCGVLLAWFSILEINSI